MGNELRVRVLGGAELALDGRSLVELASAKATALLVYLAVTGAEHPRSALAGLLWSDMPEATARANLRLALTKLRRVLPDHLEVSRNAVGLAPGQPVWVDAVEVARMAGEELDVGGLREAVPLCRGEFLQGFEVPAAALFDEWVMARRASYRAAMLAVMDRAMQCARDLDDPAAGVAVARRLLELEPLHEEAHRALMWFLARGGQRGAALAQYDTCRYVLREELGVELSPATLALRDEIVRAGGFTELGEPTAARARPAGDAGGGRAAPGPAAPPAAPPDPPQPLTALVGRERELARLHQLLDDPACRLVTLVGPGGIGKTRLALEVAAARGGRRRSGGLKSEAPATAPGREAEPSSSPPVDDGAVFVSFVGTMPARPEEAADLVVANLAAALGVSLAVPRDPLELLAEDLAGRELLLVLDNFEQLREAAGVVAELLRRARGVQVLCTSRRRLGLGVEWLVEVPGLPYPPPGMEGREGYDAVRLFEDRARPLRPGPVAPAERESVGRLCRLLGGVPLAIELAAHLVRSAPADAIVERLATGLDLFATSAPDVEPRHRSLRSVVDSSWQLLTAEERRVLRRLSVLRGGFDLPAAAAVAEATLPVLAALVDHSLIEVGEDGRYGVHELLRQYAAERLAADPDDEAATRARHADHYAALLPDPDHTAGPGPFPDAEVENLRAATDWLLQHADPDRLDAHLGRLWPYYRRKGRSREAQAVLNTALRREEVPPPARAHWHRLLGEAHMQIGEAGPARHHFERALTLLGRSVPASPLGWKVMLAGQALRRLWPARLSRRGPERRHTAERLAEVCWPLVEAYWVLEELPPMIPIGLLGLNEAELAGRADLIAPNQANLGMFLGTRGLHRLARRHVRAGVAAAERAGGPVSWTWVQIVGSLHWIGAGDWAEVEARADRVLELAARAGIHRGADQVLLLRAVAAHLTGRFSEAAAMAATAMAAGRERRDPVVQLWGLLVMSESRQRIDPAEPGLAPCLEEARELVTRNVATIDVVRAHAMAARHHLAFGRTGEAWREVRAAADLARRTPSFAQYALEGVAGIPEVCLALLERDDLAGIDRAEVRATAVAGLRGLRRYARAFPMARPRALCYLGWWRWLAGRRRLAARAWRRAAVRAERLAMPGELAQARRQLDRHLAGAAGAGRAPSQRL
jgi:DNA-binding SARP family transcriptional activator/predicted ATPase